MYDWDLTVNKNLRNCSVSAMVIVSGNQRT